ncbi:Serine/threonine-protein phosphatase OS=Streptomyces tendae OX=1932 GN=GUR47_09310 PE=4 SV=1 [Streptomyces tendae]
MLTDVSGKGMDAASRALLLSGAFGGLLGSLPPHAFLPAANGYLLRQDWDEGFATSIHLVLDLDSGDYELYSAGHPAWASSSARAPAAGRRGRPRGRCFRRVRRCAVRPGEGPPLRPGDVLMRSRTAW